MAEQKNNSIERPNHAPVANAEVKERSALQKASRSFFAEDFNKVARYVGKEIILPSVKRLIFDVFSDGLGALLWGTDSRKGKGDKFASYYGGSNRGSMYWQSGNSNNGPRTQQASSRVSGTGYDSEMYIVPSRGDAEYIIDSLKEELGSYPSVPIASLYKMLKRDPQPVDFNYGWTNLSGIDFRRLANGEFEIITPRVEPLNK